MVHWVAPEALTTIADRSSVTAAVQITAQVRPTVVGSARCTDAMDPGLVQPLGREKKT